MKKRSEKDIDVQNEIILEQLNKALYPVPFYSINIFRKNKTTSIVVFILGFLFFLMCFVVLVFFP